MMNAIRFVRVVTFGLLLLSSRPGLAQFLATAKALPKTTFQTDSPRMLPLREVLNQFKTRYQVDILFEDRLVSEQSVLPASIEPTASLEKNLTNVLRPQGLRYRKIKAGVYVILAESRSRKTTLVNDPTTLPALAVAATNPAEMNPVNPILTTGGLVAAVTDQVVSGRVVDGTNNNGLPGVSVVLKGTGKGTTTDGEGNYRLSVPTGDGTLVFSFIGYATQEIAIGNRSSINVTLLGDDKTLSEVVVVGYGTQQRRDVTGSISSLNTKAIKDQPITNIGEGLAGRLPGVLAQQTSGAPGTVPALKVRGLGSISASTGPLIVVDGQPLNDGALNLINPSDIETLDVLKDASATAIYGSRGSNGVIMITTKRGKSGATRISVDYYTGIQEISKKVNLLNSQQFAEFSAEASNNAYLDNVPGAKITDANEVRPVGQRYRYPVEYNSPASLPTYDYQSLIFQKAPISNYQVSASGGTDKVQFLVSANYLKQNGIIKQSGINRYSLRANVDARLTPRLRVGVSFSPSFTTENRANSDGHWANNGIINAALSTVPTVPIYAADGSYTSQAAYAAPYDWPGVTNPVANITEITNDIKTTRLLGSAYAELDLWKGLRYRINAGGDIIQQRWNYFQTSKLPLNQLLPPTANAGYAYSSQNINWVVSQTLNYTKTVGKDHNIDALIGMEAQRNDLDRSRTDANKFPNDVVSSLNYGTVISGYSYREQWALASYFARVGYNYKDRYLLNVSVRRDGSSRFGLNNRFGTFPSGSIGWRLSEEPFMKSIPLISDLKLKASYGLAGNNAFGSQGGNTGATAVGYNSPNYISIGLLGVDNYIFGNNLSNGLANRTLGNDDLTWEKSRQTDIGLEIGLLNNRIFFTTDYYDRITTDLLLQVQVPTLTGFSSAIKNIGKVENKGFEFALTTRNFTGPFTWSTDINLSFNRNNVLALGPTGDAIRSGSGVGETNITVIGQPLGSFYGYKQLGVFKDQTDVDAYPHVSTSRPGDVKFEDVNKDGKIDANDRTLIGNNQPDFIYGMTNSFSFKGFDLNVVIQGVQGGKILNLSRRFYENLEGSQNQLTTVLDRWRSPSQPGNGIVPRANGRTAGNNNQISSRWVEDASYLRIRNITIGYNLPKTLVSKAKMQTVRLYGGIQNVFTATKYLNYNPEVSGYESPLTGGVDYGSYPVPRTYTIGVNIGL